MTKDIGLPLGVKEDIKTEVSQEKNKFEEPPLVVMEDEVEPSGRRSLMGLNDSDEFFDVPEPTEYDHFQNEWHADLSSEQMVLLLTTILPNWFHHDSEFPSILFVFCNFLL